jgi:hypothetical protein
MVTVVPIGPDGGVKEVNTGTVTPLPLTETVLGDPVALWVKVIVPDCTPAAFGVNVTTNDFDANGATVPLVGEIVNRALFDTTEETVKVPLPVLVTITLSGFPMPMPTGPKAIDGGVAENPGATPFPSTATVPGDPAALWVKLIVPVFAPVLVGVKVRINF